MIKRIALNMTGVAFTAGAVDAALSGAYASAAVCAAVALVLAVFVEWKG